MPIYQGTIEQLATVSTIVEVEAAAAADLDIEVAPAQDWEEARHRSACTGYAVLEVEDVA